VSEFYAGIFDWKVQHRPEMNYRIVDTGGEGGINGGIVKPEREGLGLWKAATPGS